MGKRVSERSLANLSRAGGLSLYEEPKKTRGITVTEAGWVGVQRLADSLGLSISEVIERLGRGKFNLLESSESSD